MKIMNKKNEDPCADGEGDCSKASSLVDFYLDEALELEDRNFIQRHLDECPGCKGGYEFESAFHMRVRALAPIYMPDEVKTQISLALGFPGMSKPIDNSLSALGSPNAGIDPSISSQMGIPKGEIPRGEIPKNDFFAIDDPSSSDEQ